MRLTKDHREKIIKRALAKAFDKREATMKKEEAELAIEAYNTIYDDATRRKVNSLSADWFRECDCLIFTVLGKRYNLNAKKPVRTPHVNYCSNLGTLTGDMADKVEAFHNTKQKITEERFTAETKLEGMLSNISTFKKLGELWPEGKEFYADLDEDAQVKGGLPAIRFDDMNVILGITKKAA